MWLRGGQSSHSSSNRPLLSMFIPSKQVSTIVLGICKSPESRSESTSCSSPTSSFTSFSSSSLSGIVGDCSSDWSSLGSPGGSGFREGGGVGGDGVSTSTFTESSSVAPSSSVTARENSNVVSLVVLSSG